MPSAHSRHPTPHPARPPAPEPGQARFWLLLGALAFLAFVVYGSLVPLQFQPVPWDQALERFRSMPYLALGIGSRADWVSNILLFIPLCFLWSGVIWPQRRPARRIVAAALVLGAAVALSVAIEFVQIFFPPRTVSLNDIVAEAAGAAIGIALWWLTGHHVLRWLQALPLARGTANVAQRLLVAYLLVLFGYNLLPLDLTISPVEVYHKWREGKVIWLPFTKPYADGAQRAYDLVTDIVIWVPVAALWVLTGRKTRMQAWTLAVTAALVLELLQVFVYSRVSDSTDVGDGSLGRGDRHRAGTAAPGHRPGQRPMPGPGALRWAVAALCWAALLAAVFWYPFDFNLDRSFLRDRVAGLHRVPFETYYYGTEFRAITEVLRKMLFFAPLGFLLFRLGRGLPSALPRAAVHVAMLILVAAVATAIESVQILLPSKFADFTDGALQFLGGATGYFGSLFVAERLRAGAGARRGWTRAPWLSRRWPQTARSQNRVAGVRDITLVVLLLSLGRDGLASALARCAGTGVRGHRPPPGLCHRLHAGVPGLPGLVRRRGAGHRLAVRTPAHLAASALGLAAGGAGPAVGSLRPHHRTGGEPLGRLAPAAGSLQAAAPAAVDPADDRYPGETALAAADRRPVDCRIGTQGRLLGADHGFSGPRLRAARKPVFGQQFFRHRHDPVDSAAGTLVSAIRKRRAANIDRQPDRAGFRLRTVVVVTRRTVEPGRGGTASGLAQPVQVAGDSFAVGGCGAGLRQHAGHVVGAHANHCHT